MAGGGKGVTGTDQALSQMQGGGFQQLGAQAGAQGIQQAMAQHPAWLQLLLQHQAGQPIMQGISGMQGHQPIVQSLMGLGGAKSAASKGILGGLMGLL